uniref:Uncharacterized protein n=1 Tax=Panagrolaimus sp. PS1159 TaxID=55785 RepID=A0AC35FTD8_9BILA
MNSKFLLALCLIVLIAVAAAGPMMLDSEADSDMPHDRVRRQWGYGMYRPWGYGMYRPYGMMGMYRPWGMMGMFG